MHETFCHCVTSGRNYSETKFVASLPLVYLYLMDE